MPCPKCKFPNPISVTVCVQCKSSLASPAGPAAPAAAPPQQQEPGGRPPRVEVAPSPRIVRFGRGMDEGRPPQPAPPQPTPADGVLRTAGQPAPSERVTRGPGASGAAGQPTPSERVARGGPPQGPAPGSPAARTTSAWPPRGSQPPAGPAAPAPPPPPRPTQAAPPPRPPRPTASLDKAAQAEPLPWERTQPIRKADIAARAAAAASPPQSQVKPVDPQDERIVLWLECAPLAPVPVGPEPSLSIGRGAECDFVLAHTSVSRTHAVIRVTGREVLLEDRSSYGTYVNGTRRMASTLSPGDVLTIGPYELHVRGRDEAVGAPGDPATTTKPLQLGLENMATGDALSGRLERQPLAEVLQSLEFNQKTGTLEVHCDDGAGVLVVYEGQPMFATFADQVDASAVYAMLRQKKGYFSFRNKVEAGERTLNGTITGLLLEASRRQDER